MKSFKVVTAGDLLSAETAERWVVHPFLVEGSAMMLYGRQGVGKSSLAMQLAAAFAAGTDWLCYPTSRRGKTLWLQLDMPRAELRLMLQRAETAQLFRNGTRESVIFGQLFEGNVEIFEFNLLDNNDYAAFLACVQEQRPVAVIVDTVSDAYEAAERRDAGEQIRDVLRRLRHAAISVGAVTVYLHHQRKRSQQAGLPEDGDAFLGRVQWEGFATSSLQLTKGTEQEEEGVKFSLRIRKCRLASPGTDRLDLIQNEHGFFEPRPSATQAVSLWPNCVPEELRGAKSRDEVLETLAAQFGFSQDNLRQAVKRARPRPTWA